MLVAAANKTIKGGVTVWFKIGAATKTRTTVQGGMCGRGKASLNVNHIIICSVSWWGITVAAWIPLHTAVGCSDIQVYSYFNPDQNCSATTLASKINSNYARLGILYVAFA